MLALTAASALALTPGGGGRSDLMLRYSAPATSGTPPPLPNSLFDARPIFVEGATASTAIVPLEQSVDMMLYSESPSSLAKSPSTLNSLASQDPTWQAGRGGQGDMVTMYGPTRVDNIPNSIFDARPLMVESATHQRFIETPSGAALSPSTTASASTDDLTWQAGRGGQGDKVVSYGPTRVVSIPHSIFDARPLVVPSSPASPKVIKEATVAQEAAPAPKKAAAPKAKKAAAAPKAKKATKKTAE